jgi:hypothetical protein
LFQQIQVLVLQVLLHLLLFLLQQFGQPILRLRPLQLLMLHLLQVKLNQVHQVQEIRLETLRYLHYRLLLLQILHRIDSLYEFHQ